MKWLYSWQIASLSYDNLYKMLHIHEFCEILYIVEGSIRIKTANSSLVLNKGQMVIIPPLEYHSVEPLEFPYERIGIHVNCSLAQQAVMSTSLLSVLNYRTEEDPYVFDLSGNDELVKTLYEISAENSCNHAKSDEMMEVLFHSFLIRLYRLYPGRFKHPTGDALMDEAKRYIENNIENLPDINKIAGMYYLSTSHFISRFKNHTGYTPKKYCNLLRISKARYLLKETELPLCDIAEKCGFMELNSFVRSFRITMGITPGKFRELELYDDI